MKKAIWTVLIVLLAVSCSGKNVTAKSSGGSTTTVKAGTPAPASDFTVRLDQSGNGVEITDYIGSSKNLTVPATIEDMPVVGVYFKSLNPNVEQVFLPEGVKVVGNGNSYSGDVTLPNLKAVSLPSTLESIAPFAFKGCASLKSVLIPSGVKGIGNHAFESSGIQSIVIPASVYGIAAGAFKNCKSLTHVEISGNNLVLGDRLYPLFEGCDNLKSVIINEGVIGILMNTFNGKKLLETVILPNSLKVIEEKSFYLCTSLSSIVLPKGLERIDSNAFANSGLTEVTISKTNGQLEIQGGAFSYCENLVTVNFEEGVSILFFGNGQFQGCPKLSLRSQAAIRELGGFL